MSFFVIFWAGFSSYPLYKSWLKKKSSMLVHAWLIINFHLLEYMLNLCGTVLTLQLNVRATDRPIRGLTDDAVVNFNVRLTPILPSFNTASYNAGTILETRPTGSTVYSLVSATDNDLQVPFIFEKLKSWSNIPRIVYVSDVSSELARCLFQINVCSLYIKPNWRITVVMAIM